MSFIGVGLITSFVFKKLNHVKELAVKGAIKSLGLYIKIESFIQSMFSTNQVIFDQDTIYIRDDGTETKRFLDANDKEMVFMFILQPEKGTNNCLLLPSSSSSSSSPPTFDKSNVSFLAVQLKTLPEGGIYNIVLNTPEMNLMVVGNILLDKPFIKWYLRRWHHFNIKDDAIYEVSFIDQRMNYVCLNLQEGAGVQLLENDYRLLLKNAKANEMK